jgi:hypothetical protein
MILCGAIVASQFAFADLTITKPADLNFGDVRIGDSKSLTASTTVGGFPISGIGTPTLTFTKAGNNSAFGPSPADNKTVGVSGNGSVTSNNYTFTPTAHQSYSGANKGTSSVKLTPIRRSGNPLTNNGTATQTFDLTGVGVGPVLSSSTINPGDTFDFGTVIGGSTNYYYLTLTNSTTDTSSNPLLLELNLLSFAFQNGDPNFSVSIFSGDSSLSKGESMTFEIKYVAPLTFGSTNEDLLVKTDVDAKRLSEGTPYDFYFTATTATPEPATWGMGVAGLSMIALMARRRKAAKKSDQQ